MHFPFFKTITLLGANKHHRMCESKFSIVYFISTSTEFSPFTEAFNPKKQPRTLSFFLHPRILLRDSNLPFQSHSISIKERLTSPVLRLDVYDQPPLITAYNFTRNIAPNRDKSALIVYSIPAELWLAAKSAPKHKRHESIEYSFMPIVYTQRIIINFFMIRMRKKQSRIFRAIYLHVRPNLKIVRIKFLDIRTVS